MRKKGIFLGIVLLLGLTGCMARPEERPLPTLAPEVQEQDEKTRGETNGEDEESEENEDFGGLGIMSYVENSRQAKDDNQVSVLKMAIEVACYDYISDGTKLPEEPIRFRYTHELEELDNAYSVIKETIREMIGDNELTLSDEDSYMMVEISKEENGSPKIEIEIMQE